MTICEVVRNGKYTYRDSNGNTGPVEHVIIKDAKALCALASYELTDIAMVKGYVDAADIAKITSKYFGLDLEYDVNYGVLVFRDDREKPDVDQLLSTLYSPEEKEK